MGLSRFVEEMKSRKAAELRLTLSDGKYKGLLACEECKEIFDFEGVEPPGIWDREIYCPICKKNALIGNSVCPICKKDFQYAKNEKNTAPYCSEKCKETQRIADEKQQEEQRITGEIARVLPSKYYNLQTDKFSLLKGSLGKNLYIWGSPGTGKSVFAASLTKEYIRQSIAVRWIPIPSFIMRLQNAFAGGNNAPSEFARKWGKTVDETAYNIALETATFDGYLFLDDLGAEKTTEFVRQIVYYVINEREEKMLQTVITSNLPLAKITDERVASRIAGMCEILQFSGPDRRLKKCG